MAAFKRNRGSISQVSFADRIGMFLFGLAFLGMGLFFLSILMVYTYRNVQARLWQKTPCVIQRSSVSAAGDGYFFHVAYGYQWQGKRYVSSRYSIRHNAEFSNIRDADAVKKKYPKGSEHLCYVNPKRPGQAVLTHRPLWSALFILLSLMFIFIGGGLLYKTWAPAPPARTTASVPKSTDRRKLGRKQGALFFSLFFFVGLAMGVFWIFPAIYKSFSSDTWIETPCKILSSRVQSHSGSDSTTYSVDIVYIYTIGKMRYRSNRYDFIGGSSSGYQGKAAIVRRYPPGSQAICYVNPDDPSEAVLNTKPGWGLLLGLFPLVFMAVGLSGFFFMFRKKKTRTYDLQNKAILRQRSRKSAYGGGRAGQMVLKPKRSRMGKIVGMTCIALFWNGIVSIFVYLAWQEWQHGSLEFFLILILVPFVLIGLGLIGSIFYFSLAALNPAPVVTLLADSVALGRTIRLRWQISGNVYKLERFKMTFSGEEVATYRCGTKSYTDRSTFFSSVLVDEKDPGRMRQGESSLAVPYESMHSFTGDSNQVVWKIALRGDIPRWPDIIETFEIQVYPLSMEERRK